MGLYIKVKRLEKSNF